MRAAIAWFAAAALLVASVPVWRYHMGVERTVTDDEETGVVWEWFVKHKGTWQYRFQNPARPYLHAKEIDELTPAEKASFHEFCEIRYGASDAEQCYRMMCTHSAGATDGCRLYAPALPGAGRKQ